LIDLKTKASIWGFKKEKKHKLELKLTYIKSNSSI